MLMMAMSFAKVIVQICMNVCQTSIRMASPVFHAFRWLLQPIDQSRKHQQRFPSIRCGKRNCCCTSHIGSDERMNEVRICKWSWCHRRTDVSDEKIHQVGGKGRTSEVSQLIIQMNIYQSIFTIKPLPEKFAELHFAVLSFAISYVCQFGFSLLWSFAKMLFASLFFAIIHLRRDSCSLLCFSLFFLRWNALRRNAFR